MTVPAVSCRIEDCDRHDMKAYGLCNKHYKRLQYRRKNGLDYSNLKERLKRTEEHIQRLRDSYPKTHALKGKTYRDIYGDRAELMAQRKRGSNSGTWKGGASLEDYGGQFTLGLKEQIRDRDNRRCCECGCPEEELEERLSVHHVDEDKKNNNHDNLISLCRACHSKVHWGKKDWATYFRKILKEKEL